MEQFLKITIPVKLELHEILIAELGMLNFDSFQEQTDALDAFIQEPLFSESALSEVFTQYGIAPEIKIEKLQNINWNEQWEKNFDPVYIQNQVQIRASFHQKKLEYPYDIIIDPKMSFGTGHHETTTLIVSEQLTIDHQNKVILDVGTGTGVLAIMASKLGAKSLTVTDIDDWCIENCKENFNLNGIENVDILHGTIDKLTFSETFDIIFANINKNVLLAELGFYEKLLAKEGLLVLSGFYQQDLEDILQKASDISMRSANDKSLNNWAILCLKRDQA